MKRWIIFCLRVVIALVAVTAIVVRGLENAKIWQHAPSSLEVSALLIVAVAAFSDNMRGAVAKVTLPRRSRDHADVRTAVFGALVSIGSLTKKPPEALGGSVFVVKRTGPTLRERIVRRDRVRLNDYPGPSMVAWSRGKGAIGRCWEEQRPVHVDWSAIARRWADKDISQKQFDDLSERVRCGFTRKEFMSIVGKYAEILAVPITDRRGRFRGCLAIDVPLHLTCKGDPALLGAEPIKAIASTAAKAIATVVTKA